MGGTQAYASKGPYPEESHRTHSTASCDNTYAMVPTREAGLNCEVRILIRAKSCRQYRPSTYENSRLPERKLLYRINHIVCTNILGTESHSYQSGNDGSSPKTQVPAASPGPNLQTSLSEDGSLRPVNSFLHSRI